MNEQPFPDECEWPWNAPLWSRSRQTSAIFGSLRVVEGVREYCTQCGEMIFARNIACLVVVRSGGKWLSLHFHRACYVAWEQAAAASAEVGRINPATRHGTSSNRPGEIT
jgi:hypothetical protein